MFRWAEPSYFFLFFFVLLALLVSVLSFRSHKKILELEIGKDLLKDFMSNFSYTNQKLKITLKLLVLFSLVIALASPQWGRKKILVKSEGGEIVVLFDVSRSMLAEDVSPNRLEAGKKELSLWADTTAQDKLGLIIFAGSAITLTPLTEDEDAFKSYLELINENMISYQGTSLSQALKEAQGLFQRGGLIGQNQISGLRALIIVSDGELHEEAGSDSLKFFKQSQIPIFTIGMGTKKGGLIPVKDPKGNVLNYLQDKKGQPVLSVLEDKSLKKLAQDSKGAFFAFTQNGSLSQQLNARLHELRALGGKNESEIYDFDHKYFWFLFLTLAFFFLERALRLRVKKIQN